MIIGGCFAAPEPGRLAVINGSMNSAVDQNVQNGNIYPPVQEVKLKQTLVWTVVQNTPASPPLAEKKKFKQNEDFGVA